MSQAGRPIERLAEGTSDFSGESGCAFHSGLLAENGANGEFETVPRAGNAKAGLSVDDFRERGISAESALDGVPVGAEIEHGANALDDEEERARIAEVKANIEGEMSGVEGDFEISAMRLEGDGAAIDAVDDGFDAGSAARDEEGKNSGPVIRRAEAQAEGIEIFRSGVMSEIGAAERLTGQAANLRGRAMVNVLNVGIEAADGTEAGGERNVIHGKSGFVDELLGEMEAAGLRDRERRGAEMAQKQATKMTRADAEFLGKHFNTTIFEAAFADQAKGAGNGGGSSGPGGSAGRTFGAAAETGTESSFGSGRSGGKVADVFFFRGGSGAYGTAVDTAAENSDEKFPVKARVAGETSARTNVPVESHDQVGFPKSSPLAKPARAGEPTFIIVRLDKEGGRFRTALWRRCVRGCPTAGKESR